jgi:hypothetical protein
LRHQPARRGRAPSSLSDTLLSDTLDTGSGSGSTRAGAGGARNSAPKLKLVGAGSRTVEPRRGAAGLSPGGTGATGSAAGSAGERSWSLFGATSAWRCAALGSA